MWRHAALLEGRLPGRVVTAPRWRVAAAPPPSGGGAAAAAGRRVSCARALSASAPGEAAPAAAAPSPPKRPDLHVVLVNPQIPQNTGNIARSCAATNVALHLVAPLGFELDSARLRRAGLDYWDSVLMRVHPSWAAFEAFFDALPGANKMVGFSKFATAHYARDGLYPRAPGTASWLLFGAETTGLPPEAHAAIKEKGELVLIPMANHQHVRSLNLATSVGVGLFEALRQLDKI